MACGGKAFVMLQGLQLTLLMVIQNNTSMHALQIRPLRHEDVNSPGWQNLLAVTSLSVSQTHSATQ